MEKAYRSIYRSVGLLTLTPLPPGSPSLIFFRARCKHEQKKHFCHKYLLTLFFVFWKNESVGSSGVTKKYFMVFRLPGKINSMNQ